MDNKPEISLDPDDWTQARAVGHQMIDDAITHLAGLRNRAVWQPMPAQVRAAYLTPVPDGPMPLADIYAEMRENLMPYPMGGIHPRFFGWYMGGSNFPGRWAILLRQLKDRTLGAAIRRRRRQMSRWWAG